MRKSKPKKDAAVLQQEADQVSLFGVTVDNPVRGIPKDVAAFFGVRHTVDTAGNITETFYPGFKDGKVTGYKKRFGDKQFMTVGDFSNVSFFGAQQAATGGARLWITEGEEDAMSLWWAIWQYQTGTEFEGQCPAVVSLPYGNDVPAMTEHDKALIDKAKEIILVLDNDEPGAEGLRRLTKILPGEKVKVVTLPAKDPSEMLVAGKSKELAECALFRGKEYKPATMVSIGDVLEEINSVPEYGYNWPWKKLTELTYGIRPRKIYGIGAGISCSKTEFIHMTIVELIKQGIPVGAIMLEEEAADLVRAVAGIHDGTFYNRPDVDYDPEQLKSTAGSLEELLTLGADGEIETVEQAVELTRHMVLLRGAKVVCIDPVSALVDGVSASDANEKLNWMFKELENLVVALDFTVIATSHLNPPKYGKPHEEGGEVSLIQYTGSRALARKVSVALGIERNVKGENGLEFYNRIRAIKMRGCNPIADKEIFTKFCTTTGRMLETASPPGGLAGSQEDGDQIKTPEEWGAKKEKAFVVDNIDVPW